MVTFRTQRLWILASALSLSVGCSPGELWKDDASEDSDALLQRGTLSWISPTAGQTLSGSVTLEVSASTSATRVDFAVDGAAVATVSNGPPWRTTLDTTTLLDGSHKLKATSRNGSKRRRALDSKTIDVLVSNPLPTDTDAGTSVAPDASGTMTADAGTVALDAGPVLPQEVKAFPTAEGAGKNAVGGRGGKAIYVENLSTSGAGSLQACIDATLAPASSALVEPSPIRRRPLFGSPIRI